MKICSVIFLLFLTGFFPVYAQNEIVIDQGITYQKFSGWESASFITSDCNPYYDRLRDALLPYLVDSIGITRLRLEVRSGSEHTFDNYQKWLDNGCPSGTDATYLNWRESRYATVNDNNDTSINLSGFFFNELDMRMEKVVLPFINYLSKRGVKPHINLCYVAFTSQIKNGSYIHDNADEYSEFVLATYLHLFNKYRFTPDSWEILLEPDNVPQWSGNLIGQAIVKAAARLKKHGFKPNFIAPSNTNMTNAVKYFDDLIKVNGVLDFLDEISYHRYGGVSLQSLKALADRALKYNKKTSMLEWWFDNANYKILHEDITVGNASSFQQATISGYFDIDESKPENPKIKIKDITQYNRIYYVAIKPDAIRTGASSSNQKISPVAAKNADGSFAVILKSDIDTVINLRNIPNGNYSVIVTNDKQKFRQTDQLEIKNNSLSNYKIIKGLVAFVAKSTTNSVAEYENRVRISPNPASEYIEIDHATGKAEIVNHQGQPVWQGDLENNRRIDVSGFQPGIYIFRVNNQALKFVVAR